jgi:alkylation response protein AidB-like acyl-CoA dehydrogenase
VNRSDFEAYLPELRKDAAARESGRVLLHDQVAHLQRLGFGALRIPVAGGGGGASLEELFGLLVDLAAADSNLAHAYRGHIAFVETLLDDPVAYAVWLPRILAGEFVGNAQSERQETGTLSTRLTREGEHFYLDGTKYYTTGSIYADWIHLAALDGDERVALTVSTAVGVTSVDDWDGFGQPLTGSGTTVFERTPVDPSLIVRSDPDDAGQWHKLGSIFQLALLAVIAGIAEAALHDTVEYVRPRRRTAGFGGETSPRDDPLVQAVVGELSSAAYAARSLVIGAARTIDGSQDALLDVYRVQQVVPPLVLTAVTRLFEVGGASAVSRASALDRHWRNVRTVASHNPLAQRARGLGQFELNGDLPAWSAPGAPPKENA